MNTKVKIYTWIAVIASFVLIFLPSQIASQLLSRIVIVTVGCTSLFSQFMIFRMGGESKAGKWQLLILAILTIVTMCLMYMI